MNTSLALERPERKRAGDLLHGFRSARKAPVRRISSAPLNHAFGCGELAVVALAGSGVGQHRVGMVDGGHSVLCRSRTPVFVRVAGLCQATVGGVDNLRAGPWADLEGVIQSGLGRGAGVCGGFAGGYVGNDHGASGKSLCEWHTRYQDVCQQIKPMKSTNSQPLKGKSCRCFLTINKAEAKASFKSRACAVGPGRQTWAGLFRSVRAPF